MRKLLVLLPLILLVSCAHDRSADGSNIVLRRLDKETLEAAGADSITRQALADSFADALQAIALTQGIDTTPVGMLNHIYSSPYFTVFTTDAVTAYPSVAGIEKNLTRMVGNLSRLLPDISTPRQYVSYVSPYRQSIVIVDSIMLIAMNHYLGEDYPGYEGFESYMRRLKTPDRIAPDVAEALIRSSYPFSEETYSTVLSRMLYEGALLSILSRCQNNSSTAHLLGYTDDELKWAIDNEKNIWNRMASSELLYSASPSDAARLINPAPSTPLIHQDSPGRLGRFIGYRIIESYLENNSVDSLSHMLKSSFYRDAPLVLKKAGYAP